MTTADPLQAFFDAAPVAERDIAFRSQVMERVARRRLRLELGLRFAAGTLLLAMLAVTLPLILPVSTALTGDLLQGVLVGGAAVAGHGPRRQPRASGAP